MRLYHTFVHSGYIRRVVHEDRGQAINLALLEAIGLLSALVGLPRLGLRAAGERERVEA